MTPAHTIQLQQLATQIVTKELQHTALQNKKFDQLSFDERMTLFKLKAELGKLYLDVAEIPDLEARGKDLRKVVKYNPFLKPKLAEKNTGSGLMLDNLLPKTATEDNSRMAGLITTAILALPIIIPGAWVNLIAGDPVNYLYTYGVERAAQIVHVKTQCLFELPQEITAEACLSTAVAHLDKGNNFIAIRYLLEADIRCTESNPEISHYFSRCIDNLSTCNREDIRGLSHLHDLPNEQLLWPRLYEIKEKVLKGKTTRPADSPLQFIWNLTDPTLPSFNMVTLQEFSMNLSPNRYCDFSNQILGLLTSDHADYHVTLTELSQYLRLRLYSIYPEMKSSFDWNPIDDQKTRALKDISLTQLTAYMSQVCELPKDILNAGRAAYLLLGSTANEQDDQASLHLEQLHEKNKPNAERQGTSMTFLPTRASTDSNNDQAARSNSPDLKSSFL
ncbi:MAG: hypothetical protein ACHQAX_00835 [Gammaproteobacteria bacterium]